MNQKRPTVSFSHAWNRPYLPTGGADKAYLLIEARGAGTVRVERAPINLSLVLDRSGSMTGDPLSFSKKACQFVVDQMNASDVLSLVTFDDEVCTVVAPCKVICKDLMKQQIQSIRPGGSTNLSGGLIEGAQYVRKGIKEGTVNRVILLSDGHANQGITDRKRLATIAKEYRSSGVGITAMGVGVGFDEEVMEAISENGGGNFYYIDTPDRIPSIFQEELNGLLSVVAQNMRITLQTTDLTRVTNVYGYKMDEQKHTVHVGDLYHDEVKTILVEMALHPHSPGTHPVLLMNWEYTDVTEGAVSCTFSSEVQAEFTNNINLLGLAGSDEVQKQVELTESAKTIEAAMEAMDSGDLQSGKQMLKEQADHMLKMSEVLAAPSLAMESLKLLNQLENFEYSSKTRKELHEQKYRQMKRR
jgi:Ca-activated chloride channel family protein